MKEVTEREFFDFIGPKDVVITLLGKNPYTEVFTARYGESIGKIIYSYPEKGEYPLIEKYYIKE